MHKWGTLTFPSKCNIVPKHLILIVSLTTETTWFYPILKYSSWSKEHIFLNISPGSINHQRRLLHTARLFLQIKTVPVFHDATLTKDARCVWCKWREYPLILRLIFPLSVTSLHIHLNSHWSTLGSSTTRPRSHSFTPTFNRHLISSSQRFYDTPIYVNHG